MHPVMLEADSLHLSLDRLCYYDLEADSIHLSRDRLCYAIMIENRIQLTSN